MTTASPVRWQKAPFTVVLPLDVEFVLVGRFGDNIWFGGTDTVATAI